MSDRDFSFGGKDFKLSKIDAIKQFHIVRRIAPILSELAPHMASAAKFQTVKDVEKLPDDKKFDIIGKFAAPIMTGLSKLSDADADHVLYGLLESIEVKQAAGNWAKVASGSFLMMQDLEFPVLMQLAGRAFMFNLSGFFGALPQT